MAQDKNKNKKKGNYQSPISAPRTDALKVKYGGGVDRDRPAL